MSIPVALEELRAAVAGTDRAPFLVTVSDDGRPHTVAVDPSWDDDELELPVGNRSLANASARRSVTLLWPAREAGGHTLIVDVDVTDTRGTGAGDNVVRVRPTRAVLHRPAGSTTGSATDSARGADCIRIATA
jgi:hypothetical protein